MKLDKDDILKSILEHISDLDYIKTADIPNIELYMDQVTTFMDSQMASSKRYPDDKVLTKTMINNYAKNNLLPPPVKKKYSKQHIFVLIFIYYFKNILSIIDIESLLGPMTEKFFSSKEEIDMEQIYEDICMLEKGRVNELQDEIKRCYDAADELYPDLPEEDRDYLQIFAFICSLSFDVYVKKLLIEKLVDEITTVDTGKKKK